MSHFQVSQDLDESLSSLSRLRWVTFKWPSTLIKYLETCVVLTCTLTFIHTYQLIFINERLCNLNKWQTGFPHTQLTPPHSTPAPICVRVLVRVLGTVGTVEKVFFVCRVLVSEHLIVLVHDFFDRGFVRELVDHDRNHVREGVWVKINFWKLSHPWENLFHIGLICQVTINLFYCQQTNTVLPSSSFTSNRNKKVLQKKQPVVLKKTGSSFLSWVWVLCPVSLSTFSTCTQTQLMTHLRCVQLNSV